MDNSSTADSFVSESGRKPLTYMTLGEYEKKLKELESENVNLKVELYHRSQRSRVSDKDGLVNTIINLEGENRVLKCKNEQLSEDCIKHKKNVEYFHGEVERLKVSNKCVGTCAAAGKSLEDRFNVTQEKLRSAQRQNDELFAENESITRELNEVKKQSVISSLSQSIQVTRQSRNSAVQTLPVLNFNEMQKSSQNDLMSDIKNLKYELKECEAEKHEMGKQLRFLNESLFEMVGSYINIKDEHQRLKPSRSMRGHNMFQSNSYPDLSNHDEEEQFLNQTGGPKTFIEKSLRVSAAERGNNMLTVEDEDNLTTLLRILEEERDKSKVLVDEVENMRRKQQDFVESYQKLLTNFREKVFVAQCNLQSVYGDVSSTNEQCVSTILQVVENLCDFTDMNGLNNELEGKDSLTHHIERIKNDARNRKILMDEKLVELADKTKDYEDLLARYRIRDKECEELKNQLQINTESVAELKHELAHLHSVLESSPTPRDIEPLKAKVEQLMNEVGMKREKISSLEGVCHSYEEEIERLKGEINQCRHELFIRNKTFEETQIKVRELEEENSDLKKKRYLGKRVSDYLSSVRDSLHSISVNKETADKESGKSAMKTVFEQVELLQVDVSNFLSRLDGDSDNVFVPSQHDEQRRNFPSASSRENLYHVALHEKSSQTEDGKLNDTESKYIREKEVRQTYEILLRNAHRLLEEVLLLFTKHNIPVNKDLERIRLDISQFSTQLDDTITACLLALTGEDDDLEAHRPCLQENSSLKDISATVTPIRTLEVNVEELETARTCLADNRSNLSVIHSPLSYSHKEISRLEEECREFIQAIRNLFNLSDMGVDLLIQEVRRIKDDLENQAKSSQTQILSLQSNCKNIKKEFNDLKKLNQGAESEKKDLKKNLRTTSEKLTTEQTKTISQRNEIEKLRKEIEEVKTINSHINVRSKQLSGELAQKQVEIVGADSKVRDVKNLLDKCVEEKEMVRKEMGEKINLLQNEINEEKKRYKQLTVISNNYKSKCNELSEFRSKNETLIKENNNLNEEIRRLQYNLDNISKDLHSHQTKNSENNVNIIQEKDAKIKELKHQLSRLTQIQDGDEKHRSDEINVYLEKLGVLERGVNEKNMQINDLKAKLKFDATMAEELKQKLADNTALMTNLQQLVVKSTQYHESKYNESVPASDNSRENVVTSELKKRLEKRTQTILAYKTLRQEHLDKILKLEQENFSLKGKLQNIYSNHNEIENEIKEMTTDLNSAAYNLHDKILQQNDVIKDFALRIDALLFDINRKDTYIAKFESDNTTNACCPSCHQNIKISLKTTTSDRRPNHSQGTVVEDDRCGHACKHAVLYSNLKQKYEALTSDCAKLGGAIGKFTSDAKTLKDWSVPLSNP